MMMVNGTRPSAASCKKRGGRTSETIEHRPAMRKPNADRLPGCLSFYGTRACRADAKNVYWTLWGWTAP
jgi:hypothetical protein